MFSQLALVAACAFAVVSGQHASATTTVAPTSIDDVSSYGAELLGEILADLKIKHVDSQPLTDAEYNDAVDGIKVILTGNYAITNLGDVQASTKDLFSRVTPDEFEQLTDDAVAELLHMFLHEVFGVPEKTVAPTTTPAPKKWKGIAKTNHGRGAWGA
ncbi:Aste57867_21343 [Aphanomyces stellatus]|uniref:Aste57867_21343 protein n=1 Tax=Aphanomyces stellatus TaxID=120398 RepID=A0A485LH81_9STRA|nr:hypothetical protein As57867_021274 [Aphanomyces stellatus]VFT98015.1 Aste57867_21343 [Aphanomyces stellatus]